VVTESAALEPILRTRASSLTMGEGDAGAQCLQALWHCQGYGYLRVSLALVERPPLTTAKASFLRGGIHCNGLSGHVQKSGDSRRYFQSFQSVVIQTTSWSSLFKRHPGHGWQRIPVALLSACNQRNCCTQVSGWDREFPWHQSMTLSIVFVRGN
jgi:hypothetical protein